MIATRLVKPLSLILICLSSFLGVSTGYSQTKINSLHKEAQNEAEYLDKLNSVYLMISHGRTAVICQKFDRRYRDDYSLKEGLFKGYAVYGNDFINCDPVTLAKIQESLDQNDLGLYVVVNLSRASFSTPDSETILRMQNFSTPSLSFPVGYPIYSLITTKGFTSDRYNKDQALLPSPCYLNSEQNGKTIIPTETAIVSFIKYLNEHTSKTSVQDSCLKYKKEYGIDYKTVYSLYHTEY